VIAGGDKALTQAVEGAEDSAALAEEQLGALNLGPGDVVVGLAASGRTPFVVGALAYARGVGAATVSVACNPSAAISRYGDVAIEVDNGPEVLTGSTRLKAGTSQKLILNMISTATMVRLGKVYRNLMVDVGPTNEKLIARAEKIVQDATGCDLAAARDALSRTNYHAKTAIVMLIADVDAATAAERLAAADGFVRGAIAAA
jgi:N-acetylmuramic acid 6-phosphate etherase